MFEGISGDRQWYMQHIDERVQPRHQETVARRAYEAIRDDPTTGESHLMAASLLLGQYVEIAPDKVQAGKPLSVTEFSSVGLHISAADRELVVGVINETVQRSTHTGDLTPDDRPGRYVGEKDYNEKNPLGIYLEKLNGYPILADEEQRALGATIQAGRKARQELELLEDADVPFETRRNLKQQISAGTEAQLQMVLTNLRFAVFMAKRYQGLGLPLDDLIEEANIALMDAAEKWRPTHPAKFTSYAGTAIDRSIQGALQDQKGMARVPRDLHQKIREYHTTLQEHRDKYGTVPGQQELEDLYDFSPGTLKRIDSAMIVLRHADQLDVQPMRPAPEEVINEDAGVSLRTQTPEEPHSYRIEPEVEHAALVRALNSTLGTLNEREAGIIRLRFGLGVDEPRTLDEIAEIYGVTKERIRQVESRTMSKLRNPDRANHLKHFLDD